MAEGFSGKTLLSFVASKFNDSDNTTDVGSKNQRPAVLDSIAGHNTSFQSLGSQQPIELTPKISTERRDDGGRNDDPFVHHMAPNTGLLPNTKRPDNRLWVRIRDICMQDFRAEPWYLSNLWLMALVAVASACMTFPEALTRGNDLDHAVVMLVILPIIYFSTSSIIIPLCGIVNSIRDTTLSSRNPLSGIRLAIDPGKRYHAIRWIYFALLSMATGFTAYVGLPMHLYLAVPPIACCIVFGPALFTELFSIIFQVLGED